VWAGQFGEALATTAVGKTGGPACRADGRDLVGVDCPGTSVARAGGVDHADVRRPFRSFCRPHPARLGSVSRSHSQEDRNEPLRARKGGEGFSSEEWPVSGIKAKYRQRRAQWQTTGQKDLLDSLLEAWKVLPAECVQVIDAWRRVNSASGLGPANAGRFDEASPRGLGIHAAIPANDSTSDLPSYVPRKFDEQLQNMIARGAEHGCFVVLVGASSTGKTRSLYEAVYNAVPNWWLVQPTKTQEIFDPLETPTALAPAVGPRAGTLGGYVVADYLAQHIRRVRRIECPPASLWAALLTHVRNSDDLRRLVGAATARMRYGYAELALRRLFEINDSIAGELAALLVAQNRCGEAIALIDQRLGTAPNDRQHAAQREKIVALQGRAELLRQAAGHPQARARLDELLADGGMADDLRTRAAAGDRTAADQLAEILADRGCLDELRERADAGHQFAAERLADFLAWPSPDQPDVIELRVAADADNEEAASQLAALLFDARDQAALLAEVNAGTYRAADRYLALLTAEQSLEPALIGQIRAFGLDADGSVRGPRESR
jgi:hypothetical protein